MSDTASAIKAASDSFDRNSSEYINDHSHNLKLFVSYQLKAQIFFPRLTKNVKVERGSPLTNCVSTLGAAADIIQIKDCH